MFHNTRVPRVGVRRMSLLEVLIIVMVCLFLVAILFPVFMRSHEKSRGFTCSSCQRQIAASLLMYAQDHEKFPPATSIWVDINVDACILIDPTLGKRLPNAYGYQKAVGGIYIGKLADPEHVLLTADCRPGAPSPNLLLTTGDIDPRHKWEQMGCFASYVDGHVGFTTITPGLLAVKLTSPPAKAH